MNVFLFTFNDTYATLVSALAYGIFFGNLIALIRFLLFTFLERHEA